MPETKVQTALAILRRQGMARPRDLVAQSIPGDYLDRLRRRGLVERVGRGLYALVDGERGKHHLLAEACLRVPGGVVCLLSALHFHELLSLDPESVWVALPVKARTPRVDHPPLRIARFSGPALTHGIETHRIEGVEVRVYGVAKTVADCFKFRNKVGLDVALDALRGCLNRGLCTEAALVEAAGCCRMRNVMRPYLASLFR